MVASVVNNSISSKTSSIKISLIGLMQLSVGMVTIVVGSFINSEMALIGWKSSQISIFLGIGIYFEVVRIFVGRLSDYYNAVKPFLIFSFLLSIVGFLSVPYTISPIGNPLIIVSIILFSIGTAIMSTLIDSHVTAISHPSERNRIAGLIQGFRLSGFAVGGILGYVFYKSLEFSQFIQTMALFYSILTIVSLLNISDRDRIIQGKTDAHIFQINWDFLFSEKTIMMILFLVIYPISLFMQDNILEPFAIDELGFNKDGIGRLSTIWGVVTLLFVPMGVKISNAIGRFKTLAIGQILSSFGLGLLIYSGLVENPQWVYAGLTLFGIGAGIYSVPGISSMFDLASEDPAFLATNLAIFGILVTIARGSASLIAGFILSFSNENYYLVFLTEIIFCLVSIFPFYKVENALEVMKSK